MLSFQIIKHYIISIFPLFFLLLTNNTASAIEKEFVFPYHNYFEVELEKQTENFVFSSANSENNFSNPKNYICLSRRECVGTVISSAAMSTSTLVHNSSEADYPILFIRETKKLLKALIRYYLVGGEKPQEK